MDYGSCPPLKTLCGFGAAQSWGHFYHQPWEWLPLCLGVPHTWNGGADACLSA